MIANKTWVCLYLALGACLLNGQAITYLASNPNGHSFEFVERGDQNGDAATTYGYLSHVYGIDDALLFANVTATQPPNEVNAKLTVVSKLTFTSRFVNANIIVATQDEALTVYFTDFPTPRDFTKADTFTQGAVVATFHNRVQTILNVQTPISAQSPGRGIIQANTESTQVGSTVFTLSGKSYALGQIGSTYRMTATGQGTLTSASPLIASFVFGGFAEEESNRRSFLRF
jgi:hypothetical protein